MNFLFFVSNISHAGNNLSIQDVAIDGEQRIYALLRYSLLKTGGAIVRFNENGTLDVTFGENGFVVLDSVASEDASIDSIEIKDDVLWVGGSRFNEASSAYDEVVVKITPLLAGGVSQVVEVIESNRLESNFSKIIKLSNERFFYLRVDDSGFKVFGKSDGKFELKHKFERQGGDEVFRMGSLSEENGRLVVNLISKSTSSDKGTFLKVDVNAEDSSEVVFSQSFEQSLIQDYYYLPKKEVWLLTSFDSEGRFVVDEITSSSKNEPSTFRKYRRLKFVESKGHLLGVAEIFNGVDFSNQLVKMEGSKIVPLKDLASASLPASILCDQNE